MDEISQSIRFITFRTLLPAVVVGGLGILAGLYFLVRSLLRSRRLAPARTRDQALRPRLTASPQPAPPSVNA